MNIVDLLILITLAGYCVTGFRNGAVVGALSIAGFLAGAVVGSRVGPVVGRSISAGDARYPLALAVIVAAAVAGQLVGVFVAARVRNRLTWAPARTLDSALGALLSAVGVSVVVWMMALALAASPIPSMSRAVRESRIVQGLDTVMPGPVRSVYSSVRQLAQRNGFPQVYGALTPTRIRDVATPDSAVVASAAIARERASIVKVVADGGCDHGSEGSGFVYAPRRVLTNAHVVAGMSRVNVQAGTRTVAAAVVLFDPARDVAVLELRSTRLPALSFVTEPVAGGSSVVVAGYPQDGPFDLQPARIRERQRVTGSTIYDGRSDVTRDIYTVRGVVRPGNSGGPLLDPAGRVVGVVFARAADSDDTGFVLSAAEVAGDAHTGRRATRPVGTQQCT